MDRQSLAGDDPPPAYTLQSSTPLVAPTPQGLSSRQSPRYSHLGDPESPPLPPPSASPPPSPQVPIARPTQDPSPSGRVIPPTAPAGALSSASSASPHPSGFLSHRPKWLRNLSKETSARKEQAEAQKAARQKAAAEARKKAVEERALVEQRERARRKTRDKTQELLRALVSQVSLSEEEFRSALRSYAQACAAKDINFAALLQEPILAGDLPVYWAIIKRSAAAMRPVQGEEDDTVHRHDDPDALVLAILDFSRPLQSATVVAARRACMAVSDNALFRRLCGLFKEFAPVSDTDAMLLEGSGAQDDVVVEELSSNDGAFVARIKLAQFRLRMRVSKRVCVEFVARDRMWCLTFDGDTFPAGTFPVKMSGESKSGSSGVNRPWVVSLQLGEHSLPAWVDAELVVTGNSPALAESEQSSSNISIPLRSIEGELQHSQGKINAILDKRVTGTDLPDGLSSFVDATGVLNMRLEAKLAAAPPGARLPSVLRPAPQVAQEDECVVC